MKMVIDGPFTDEDFIRFGKFLRNMWKDTSETCCVLIKEGTGTKTKEQLHGILMKIFKESPEYHEITITEKQVEEFHRRTTER